MTTIKDLPRRTPVAPAPELAGTCAFAQLKSRVRRGSVPRRAMRARPLIRSTICALPAIIAATAASVALSAGAIGPHAAGGFRSAHLAGSQVWTVSAPRLRRAHPSVVWDLAWRCRQLGQRIVSVSWQALRYAPPSGLLVRVT